MSLTADQARRVNEAIADCDRFIAREENRLESLRPAEVQKLLDWHIAHRIKLIAMLAAA